MQGLQPSDRQELVFLEMTSFAVAAARNRGISVERVDDQFLDVCVAPQLPHSELMLLDTAKQQSRRRFTWCIWRRNDLNMHVRAISHMVLYVELMTVNVVFANFLPCKRLLKATSMV